MTLAVLFVNFSLMALLDLVLTERKSNSAAKIKLFSAISPAKYWNLRYGTSRIGYQILGIQHLKIYAALSNIENSLFPHQILKTLSFWNSWLEFNISKFMTWKFNYGNLGFGNSWLGNSRFSTSRLEIPDLAILDWAIQDLAIQVWQFQIWQF